MLFSVCPDLDSAIPGLDPSLPRCADRFSGRFANQGRRTMKIGKRLALATAALLMTATPALAQEDTVSIEPPDVAE